MKRILCLLLVVTLPFGSVLADALKSKNAKETLDYQHQLPNVPGKSIKVVLVEYGPGGYSPGTCIPNPPSSTRPCLRGRSAIRILVAGATGAIGRPLVRRLRANQHEVFALARSPDSAPDLKEIGAQAVIADALDAAAVKTAVGRIRPDAVINELTSLPRHYSPPK
jgi:hypothetical protein